MTTIAAEASSPQPENRRSRSAYFPAPERPPSLGNVVAGVALCLNIGALIWGAAKIDSAVETLKDTTSGLITVVRQNEIKNDSKNAEQDAALAAINAICCRVRGR